jgi:hypothetical protein
LPADRITVLQKAMTIGLVVAALAATLPFVFAGSKTDAATEAVPPEYKIAARVRMADASVVVPSYDRGPRIIHVPQRGERNERVIDRASVDRDDPDLSNNEDDYEATPPRRRVAPPPVRTTPRWAPRREALAPPKPVRRADLPKFRTEAPVPQPPSPRRAVLSAPPPPAEGPTPIRPTPRFGSKAEAGEMSAAPRAAEITADMPPPGYTPPLAAPHIEEPDDDTPK